MCVTSCWEKDLVGLMLFLTLTSMFILNDLHPFTQTVTTTNVTFSLTGTLQASSFKIGAMVGTYNYAGYTASELASSFNSGLSWWIPSSDTADQYDQLMSTVHSINPNFKFLIYRNCMSIYNYWPSELAITNESGWLLKDAHGNYVTEASSPDNYMVDITNPSYQQWLANTLETWLTQHPQLNGVFLDNGLKYNAADFVGCASSTPINPSTRAPYTDQQIQNGYINLLNTIINTIGTNKILMPNGVWNGNVWADESGYQYILSSVPRLNALTSEGAFMGYNSNWYSVSSWKDSVNFISWAQQNLLAPNSPALFSPECISSVPPAGATEQQVMEFGLASTLLAVNNPQNVMSFGLDYAHDSVALGFVQKVQNLNLVAAVGSYYQVGLTQVFERDFTAGHVLVNPSSTAYTIQLGGSYTTFEGVAVSGQITVNPHTAIILLS